LFLSEVVTEFVLCPALRVVDLPTAGLANDAVPVFGVATSAIHGRGVPSSCSERAKEFLDFHGFEWTKIVAVCGLTFEISCPRRQVL
jgi:hypothetical protein